MRPIIAAMPSPASTASTWCRATMAPAPASNCAAAVITSRPRRASRRSRLPGLPLSTVTAGSWTCVADLMSGVTPTRNRPDWASSDRTASRSATKHLARSNPDASETGCSGTLHGSRTDSGQIDPDLLSRFRRLDEHTAGPQKPLLSQSRQPVQHHVGPFGSFDGHRATVCDNDGLADVGGPKASISANPIAMSWRRLGQARRR